MRPERAHARIEQGDFECVPRSGVVSHGGGDVRLPSFKHTPIYAARVSYDIVAPPHEKRNRFRIGAENLPSPKAPFGRAKTVMFIFATIYA